MTTTMPETVESLTTFDPFPYEDTDDGKQHMTHIIRPWENLALVGGNTSASAQDIVDLARISGKEVVALCGYRWVPVRNPEKHPVCQSCMDLAGAIMRDLGQ